MSSFLAGIPAAMRLLHRSKVTSSYVTFVHCTGHFTVHLSAWEKDTLNNSYCNHVLP